MYNNSFNTNKYFSPSSILNILGMTVAFAALYILLVQVHYDLTYNKGLKDLEKLYIVAGADWDEEGKFQINLNRPLTKTVLDQSPAIEEYGVAGLVGLERLVTFGEGADAKDYNLRFSQITLGGLKVFGFEAVEGTFDGINETKSLAISESAAKIMGVTVGDVINADGINVPVIAIYKDMPKNSDLNIDVVYSYNYESQSLDDWSEWSYHHFVKIDPENVAAFEEAALEVVKKEVGDMFGAMSASESEVNDYINICTMSLIPMSDLYYTKLIDNPAGRTGNKTTTYTLLTVAILIVVITLINYVNFFFAQVPTRIRAVNTKKILGSSRSALVVSFMIESGILVLVSFFFATLAVSFFNSSPYANWISCPLDFGSNILVVFITIIAALVMTIASSVYPALYITSFSPAFAIKGAFGTTQSGKTLRYTLIGLQFVISISFVICACFVKMQHSYMMNYDMGFNKECLMTVNVVPVKGVEKEAFEAELLNNPQIKECAWAATSFVQPIRMGWGRMYNNEQISFDSYPVSYNFLKFMGIDVIEGRDFMKSDEQCENGVFIFNEAAKKQFDLKLENKMKGHADETDIVGFCEDFQFKPLQYGVAPFAFYVFGKNPWWEPQLLYFRTTENADIESVMEYVRETVIKFVPDYNPEYIDIKFFDEELGAQYLKEKQLTKMVTLFSLLAIIISLMGVLGLVLFETEYRRKEIGLRRVHGATVGGILRMFNLKFAKILLICMVVSVPVSYFIIDFYYSTFAYRSPIYWWVFLLSFIAVAAIVFGVVTLCSWKSATENPVESLKNE